MDTISAGGISRRNRAQLRQTVHAHAAVPATHVALRCDWIVCEAVSAAAVTELDAGDVTFDAMYREKGDMMVWF